ncbi:MAG: hypothetical protein KJ574_01125 [Nanoarchaeota archaeon]|nr:hypothetical protein [Nanoarchaeota archaeon]
MKTKLFAVFLVAICTILTAAGSLLFKLGMMNFVFSFVGLLTNYYLISGLIVYGVGLLILLFALKNGELSVLYPITALTYIWSLLLAAFILHENVSYPEVFGVVLILLGVSAIGKGSMMRSPIKIKNKVGG